MLVGVDGSEAAQRAARHAFGLASRLADSVTLVHVLPPPPVLSEPAVVPNIAELERQGDESGKAILDKLAGEGRGRGVEVGKQILSGSAAGRVAEAAKGDDLGVVQGGNRGRHPVRRLLP